jgi:hypothetical protein
VLIAVAVVVSGCASAPSPPSSIPDPDRIAALEQIPQVSLRGPDNPTLDPDVLSEFWDSARVRGAAPLQATPAGGSATPPQPPAGPPPAAPFDAAEPFGDAAVVLAPDVTDQDPTTPNPAESAPAEAAGRADQDSLLEVASAPELDPTGTGSRAAGRLFFTLAGKPRSCTATIVASGTGRVLATAGHCVLTDGIDGPRQHAANLMFAPGFRDGEFPWGRWYIESVHIARGWVDRADWSQDVAFLRVHFSPEFVPIERAVGAAQGLAFGSSASGSTALLGYPAVPPFDGATLRWCGTNHPEPPTGAAPGGLGVRCAMTSGYSGGPTLTRWDSSTATGYVIAIASHDFAAGTVYGARLDADALAAYREADR